MSFSIYARGPVEEGPQDPHNQWETYAFADTARYSVLPSGVLIVNKDGEGSCWVLAPGRWQWVRTTRHIFGEEGDAGADEAAATS
jgi:hypothetical protein